MGSLSGRTSVISVRCALGRSHSQPKKGDHPALDTIHRLLFVLIRLAWVFVIAGSASASWPAVAEDQKSNPVNVHQNSQQGRPPGRDNVTVAQGPFDNSGQQKPNGEQSDAEKPWWQTPQWVVVVITAVYALFAGFQWWAIKVQSKNFVNMERPWIFVGKVNLANPLAPNAPVVVNYNWANNGRTLAVIFEQNVELRLVESLPRRPRYNPNMKTGGMGILSTNTPSPDFKTTSNALSPNNFAQIIAGQKRLYWLGRVLYEDAIRKRHTYQFCFRYFPGSPAGPAGLFPDGPKAYNWRN
jgi:hypothetical protein